MLDPSITIAIEGELSLSVFARGVDCWCRFVTQLTAEVSSASDIVWRVDDLSGGSLVVTAHTDSPDQPGVARVVRAYLAVGRAWEAGEGLPYSAALRDAAFDLMDMVDAEDGVDALRFQTSEGDVTITTREGGVREPAPTIAPAYGSVEGWIQSRMHRKGLRFTLRDVIFDQAVSCYLRPDQAAFVERNMNQLIVVDGLICRDPGSGRPVAIREITDMRRLSANEAGAYRAARGIVPLRADDERPEALVRRIRDAW